MERMVWLVETDLILAAINPKDPKSGEARRIINQLTGIHLSPYTIIEIDLLIRSENLRILDQEKFWQKLTQALQYHEIRILSPKPEYHRVAHRLREKHKLTYFDSLHAATAITEELTLISYDEKAYQNLPELKYKHPTIISKD